MNPESDFRIESTYDRQAYQAMAKATWKLFQKHRMEVMAYPALISVALVIAVLLVFNWNHTVLPIRILGVLFRSAVRGDPPGRAARSSQDVPESDP